MTDLRFFLGTHHPAWLRSSPLPLFISDRRLRGYKTLPRAAAPWALDSGGFTELSQHGTWENGPTPRQYIARVRRYHQEIGGLAWVAPQDWMCEPFILSKTGLTIPEHLRRTVDNYERLRDLAVDAGLPADLVKPVAQGWAPDDYLRCVDVYARRGIDLRAERLVCVGTVCRRQATGTAGRILAGLRAVGLTRLHGFGFKVQGLERYADLLISADSLAWSYAARRQQPLPECTGHINCANCPRYAYQWHRTHIEPIFARQRVMATAQFTQPTLFAA